MSESLAIIGISCLFPKADDLRAYWGNIKKGVDAITAVPESHWKIADYFNQDPKAPDHTYAQRGGFLSPFNFDPLAFGIAPKDIEATDTTQLLGLVAARQALLDAGYGAKPFPRERTSVILGVTGALELVIPLGARLGHPIWRRALKEAGVPNPVAEDVVQRISASYVGWQENSFPGLLGNVTAGRIASRLDLGGTNCVVDAACASSLAALHLASLELASHRADMVLAGGIDTFNDIFMFMCFSKTPALSPSGVPKPFARDADGTILGEGLGILVLKRLSDAERDHDRIYALIKGIGSSSDGKGNAIYAPRAEGQRLALRRAYADAGVTPDTVELIEAHGTGTNVGDNAELLALTEVFREARAEGSWAALGSVKSQIGHAKAAAGVAGLIKAALALERKVLPPTINVTQPAEELAPGRSPFYLNTLKRPWLPPSAHPRRAGVSSFGFGGTNFHCVLEEHNPSAPTPGWDGDVEILALAADQREGLQKQVSDLPHLAEWPELRARARQSRESFPPHAPWRLLVPLAKETDLGALKASLLRMLDERPKATHWFLPSGAAFGSGPCRGKLAAVFPGQGSQYVGMFRDLACQFPALLEALTEADRVFADEHPEKGTSRLSDFIYPHPAFSAEAREQQESALKATEIAQPALGAVGLGALKVLTWFGVASEAAAGHSYGELLALCSAGRLEPEALHRLSNRRGRLMASHNGHADRGAMLSVQAPEEAILHFLAQEQSPLVIANRNSPNQYVLAGAKAHIESAAATLARQSFRTRILPVSAAFHSPLVADAREPFAAALEQLPFHRGQVPVYANVTARAYPAGAAQARALLADQIVSPVNFVGQVEAMCADGVTTFLEIGPGHVLSDLIQTILRGRDVDTIPLDASRGSRSGTFDLAVVLCRLAALSHHVELTRWEEPGESQSAAFNGKPGFTVALTGANYRRRAPQPAPGVPLGNGSQGEPAARAENPAPSKTPKAVSALPDSPILASDSPTGAPHDPARALRTAEQGILALQKLQEQTAELHRQFLENQDAARRTIEALLTQRRQLLAGDPGSLPNPVPPRPPDPASIPNLNAPPPSPASQESPAPDPAPPVPNAMGNSDRAAQVLLNIVADKTGYPVEMLNLEMGLDSDLGIDSIKRVEIMAALRTAMPEAPEIKPEQLGALQTLRQIFEFVSGSPDKTSDATPSAPSVSCDLSSVPRGRAGEVLLKVVSDKTGYPVDMLNLDMGLDSDLGIDSIKRVEIMAALRCELPSAPEIKPEHLGTLRTLNEIVEFLLGNHSKIEPSISTAADSTSNYPTAPAFQLSADHSALEASGQDHSALETAPHSTLRTPHSALDGGSALVRQVIQPVQLVNLENRSRLALSPGARIWVTEDGSGLAAAVEQRLEQLGYSVCRDACGALIARVNTLPPRALVVLWPTKGTDDAALKEVFRVIQAAAPALRRTESGPGGILLTVSRLDGVFGFGGLNGHGDPISGGLAGLVKTAHHEWPEVHCKALDLSPDLGPGTELAARIVEEMFLLGPVEVGLTGSARMTLRAQTIPLPAETACTLDEGDLVVVTGGARGVTGRVALELARRYRTRLVLLGRSASEPLEPEWLANLNQEADIKRALLARAGGTLSPRDVDLQYRTTLAQREIREQLKQIQAAGATVSYRAVDVRNAAEVGRSLEEVRRQLGPIRGLVHGAGVLADRRIEDKTPEQFDLVYDTKVTGLRNLLAAVTEDDLKVLALFSSYSGRFGRVGQADYAAANEVLNKIAQSQARHRPNCRVVSFNWGPWNGGMVSDRIRKLFEQEGVGLIEPHAGAEFFLREISSPAERSVEVLALASPPLRPDPEDAPAVVAPHTLNSHSAFEFEVNLDSVPCLASHVLGSRAVLPAALMIEWLAHGALHANPGLLLHGLDNFKVLKGLVLDRDQKVLLNVVAEPAQITDGLIRVPVRLLSRASGKQVFHASAEIILAETLPPAPARPMAPLAGLSANGRLPAYTNGQLFHGPHFQGIQVLAVSSEREMAALILSAPPPREWIRNPLRPAWLADPLVLDGSFQMMTLWTWEHCQTPSLPCAIRRFRLFTQAFPKSGSRVVVKVGGIAKPLVTAGIDFFSDSGALFAAVEDYECVQDQALIEAFRLNRL